MSSSAAEEGSAWPREAGSAIAARAGPPSPYAAAATGLTQQSLAILGPAESSAGPVQRPRQQKNLPSPHAAAPVRPRREQSGPMVAAARTMGEAVEVRALCVSATPTPCHHAILLHELQSLYASGETNRQQQQANSSG
jgi:hypothetical protein